MYIRVFSGTPIMNPLSDLRNLKWRIQDDGLWNKKTAILVEMYIQEYSRSLIMNPLSNFKMADTRWRPPKWKTTIILVKMYIRRFLGLLLMNPWSDSKFKMTDLRWRPGKEKLRKYKLKCILWGFRGCWLSICYQIFRTQNAGFKMAACEIKSRENIGENVYSGVFGVADYEFIIRF